ncbi:hypothetical protein B5P45_18365 [Phyllobacterium zundukense]|uniref:Uncharacterized protein n=1 Tax=Phyllobacterium zundukense TaxID=1867719 RepID=A0A2N9VVE3_9HYPH|nr:hypothetical protein B5P45_18365 [Phyllobacterium zundukense]
MVANYAYQTFSVPMKLRAGKPHHWRFIQRKHIEKDRLGQTIFFFRQQVGIDCLKVEICILRLTCCLEHLLLQKMADGLKC